MSAACRGHDVGNPAIPGTDRGAQVDSRPGACPRSFSCSCGETGKRIRFVIGRPGRVLRVRVPPRAHRDYSTAVTWQSVNCWRFCVVTQLVARLLPSRSVPPCALAARALARLWRRPRLLPFRGWCSVPRFARYPLVPAPLAPVAWHLDRDLGHALKP